MGRTCSQARSQLLGLCVNVMGSTERIKKTRQTCKEMDVRLEEIQAANLTTRSARDRNGWKK